MHAGRFSLVIFSCTTAVKDGYLMPEIGYQNKERDSTDDPACVNERPCKTRDLSARVFFCLPPFFVSFSCTVTDPGEEDLFLFKPRWMKMLVGR